MTRSSYSQGKRQRETDKARKKREKAQRRLDNRDREPAEDMIVTAEDILGNTPTPAQAMRSMAERDRAPQKRKGAPCRMFVGSLGASATLDGLRELFGAFGEVIDAVILPAANPGAALRFGFVTLDDHRDATRAVKQLNGSPFGGGEIVVRVANEGPR